MFALASSAAAGGGVFGSAFALRVSLLVVFTEAAEILRRRVWASRASELDGYSFTSHRSISMALSRSCLAPYEMLASYARLAPFHSALSA